MTDVVLRIGRAPLSMGGSEFQNLCKRIRPAHEFMFARSADISGTPNTTF